MSSVMEPLGRSGMEIWQREWLSPSWWGKPVSTFLIHKMEIKRTGPTDLTSSVWNRNKRILRNCFGNYEVLYKYLWSLWLLRCLLADSFVCSGLIEHEGRNVLIALKTKQAIRNVIAKALKNLTFLWSRGIIDDPEGIEMNKVTKQFPILLDSTSLAPQPALLLWQSIMNGEDGAMSD